MLLEAILVSVIAASTPLLLAASVQAFISLGIGGVMMGMVAPILHGNLGMLALISLAAYLIAWFAWRGGQMLRREQSSRW